MKSIHSYLLLLFIFVMSCENDSQSISTNPKEIGPINQIKLATINDSLMQVANNYLKINVPNFIPWNIRIQDLTSVIF